MAIELADRIAIAAAIRLLDVKAETGGGPPAVFVPATDATDDTRCLWIEDAEVDGVRGWNLTAVDTASVLTRDQTPLAPLETIPGQVTVDDLLDADDLAVIAEEATA